MDKKDNSIPNFSFGKASMEYSEQINIFNRVMAKETEDVELDAEVSQRAVKRFINTPELGFYILGFSGESMASSTMITFEHNAFDEQIVYWYQSVYVRPEYR